MKTIKPKGEYKCYELNCTQCPFHSALHPCLEIPSKMTLFEGLEIIKENLTKTDYEKYKKRLEAKY